MYVRRRKVFATLSDMTYLCRGWGNVMQSCVQQVIFRQSRVSMDNYNLKQERIIMQRNVLKSMAPLFFICLCACLFAGCGSDGGDDGDGGGDGGNGGTEYKIGDLVGTWEIVHTKYTRRENGRMVDSGSADVSGEHNRFVFYSNGRFEFLEYDGGGIWHQDGRGTFYMRNGNVVFEGDDFEDASILSLSASRLVVKYKVTEEKGNVFIETEYTDTMERIDENSPKPGDEGSGAYTKSDLVGTWEIVHSQYVYKKDGSVIDAGSMDVSGEHNRFAFYSDGRFEFLEYDGDSRWHEDGKGTFYLRDGNFVFEGSYFHDARILSLSKTRLVARYTVVEKTAVIAGREYTDVECEMTETMERIN